MELALSDRGTAKPEEVVELLNEQAGCAGDRGTGGDGEVSGGVAVVRLGLRNSGGAV